MPRTVRGKSGVRSLSAVLDVMAGISLANKLNSAPKMPIADLSRSSMVVAATETKMGMYKEYTIDKVDDSSLDSVKRNYKTAEETDDSKDKVSCLPHN